MPSFSQRSLDNLSQCHPDLQLIFNTVVRDFDCTVICGHRGKEEQEKAYAEGKSKARWGESKHNLQPSMAADVVPYPIDWNDTDRMRHFAGYVKGVASILYGLEAISHKLRWGGDWDNDTELSDNKFNDFPHFELVEKLKG